MVLMGSGMQLIPNKVITSVLVSRSGHLSMYQLRNQVRLLDLQAVHEHGGFGSAGYGYRWKRSEAQKNLLRTHTTAVSSRMLYKLAQEGFK